MVFVFFILLIPLGSIPWVLWDWTNGRGRLIDMRVAHIHQKKKKSLTPYMYDVVVDSSQMTCTQQIQGLQT